MLSAQTINAHFTVAGQKLPVSHFSLTESISHPTELQLSLAPSRPQPLTSYIGQATQFCLESADGTQRTWHVICDEVRGETLICHSAWHQLFKAKRVQRVFCQVNLRELVDSMIPHIDWSLSHEDWGRAQVVQADESDGAFIQRILGRENIQWFSRHTEDHEVIHCVDHPRFLQMREESLVFRPPQIFHEDPRPGIFELESFHRGPLDKDEWQDEMPLRLYSGIPCLYAGVSSAGMPVKSYQPLAYEPEAYSKNLRARMIKENDLSKGGYRAVRFQSTAADLCAGMIVNLMLGCYRINSVNHVGISEQGGEGSTLRYQNTVIAQENTSPWRGVLYPAPIMPLVFQAKIESAHEFTHLDENGREIVRSLLDTHSSENIKASIPLPRLTPFAHATGGLQCPLYPGTEVLMSCLSGELDLPVIIGSVFNEQNPSPVNNSNPYLNLLRTQQNQEWILDDTPSAPFVEFSTRSGHRLTLRNKVNPGFFITCVGGMIFSSRGEFTWKTGEHFISTIQEAFSQRAGQDQHIRTEEGDIVYQSARDQSLHALNQIEAQAGKDLKISAQDYQVKIQKDQTILLEQGDATFTIAGASLVEVSDQIILSSVAGDLVFSNQSGSCGIKLTQSGLIHLFGKQLLTNIELQQNAGTINHL